MKATSDAVSAVSTMVAKARTADFFELTKPRITVLVVATTLAAFYLGTGSSVPFLLLWHTIFGTALVAGGASAFNMYLERDLDALMHRTTGRPLPSGRLQSGEALVFATFISGAGMVYLFTLTNPLTSLLSALTFLSYLFLYTPLKTRTWWATIIGAVPGALPVTLGWAAATGGLSREVWVLFAILFLWQLPHFYAIGWIHREDYARAGYQLLPVVDPSGARTARQAIFYIAALTIVSAMPAKIGLAGMSYLVGALALGFLFLAYGIAFSLQRDRQSARHLFLVSIVYLPVLLSLLILDKVRL